MVEFDGPCYCDEKPDKPHVHVKPIEPKLTEDDLPFCSGKPSGKHTWVSTPKGIICERCLIAKP